MVLKVYPIPAARLYILIKKEVNPTPSDCDWVYTFYLLIVLLFPWDLLTSSVVLIGWCHSERATFYSWKIRKNN